MVELAITLIGIIFLSPYPSFTIAIIRGTTTAGATAVIDRAKLIDTNTGYSRAVNINMKLKIVSIM